MSETILIVDDDANLLSAMKRQLKGRFSVVTAQGGEDALAYISGAKERPAVVLCDMRMGGIDGIETLRKAKDITPDSVRMMLTGNADFQTAIDAINNGFIFRFLTKPCAPEHLEAGLVAALEYHHLIVAERELLESTLTGSIKVMTEMLAVTYPKGYSRSARVRKWVRRLNTVSGMPHRWQLDIAAMLAPMGMISLPDGILTKVDSGKPLTNIEQRIYNRAPEMARDVIANIPRLQGVAQIVYLQNRGFDGTGFPDNGPAGLDIPVDARLLKILNDLSGICRNIWPDIDDFDALEANAGCYDMSLFRLIRTGLELPRGSGPVSTRKLPTSQLQPDMDLADDVIGEGGRLILASLTPLSVTHINRLQNMAKLKIITDVVVVYSSGASEMKWQ